MKKILTITIEVDPEHPFKDEWLEKKHFILNEIDEVLDDIRGNGKYKKCGGKSPSGATTYRVNVKSIK